MDNNDFQQHYNAFKWAVSRNWKDRNYLHEKIQYKMNVLRQEYHLSEREVIDDLFSNYWERGHYKKYDETKGSLNNWIAGHVNLYLNHLIRKYAIRSKKELSREIDPLDQRNRAQVEWIDRDNTRDDPDYQPEVLIDENNPESLLIAKETLDLAYGHFGRVEIDYLMGEIDLDEAANLLGISPDVFRKRIDRRRVHFRQAMQAIDPR